MIGAESSTNSQIIQTAELAPVFAFRPWVRRAGLSIIAVAAALTGFVLVNAVFSASARYGWTREPFVAVYLAVLWLGGLRIFGGTFRPIAQFHTDFLDLRPLHGFRPRRIGWASIEGTEQMLRGDRFIIYFETPRGRRFVALNLNLIKGRREFLSLLEQRLRGFGFSEKLIGESRYLSRPTE